MADKDNCRMLTEIPLKDWIGCPATVSSLSALVGAIVPGQLRKLETVFEVVGLQVCVEPIWGYDCVFARGEKLFRTMF